MSTYYYFYCKKCNLKGGFFTRQAWGWGNARIIDSFRFIMKHTGNCGEDQIKIICENFTNTEEDTSEDLLRYFPASCDWEEWKEEYTQTLLYRKKCREDYFK